MRILILSQWFDPEPTFKGLQFAKELQRLGHEVEVLTGFPNYPGGKVYPGYRIRLMQSEVMDGVHVLRVPLYPSHSKSALARILNYVSFAVSAGIGALFVRQPDVVYVYHPPATTVLPAMILKVLRGAPFVYDIQDLWPESLIATGMMNRSGLLKQVDGFLRRVYHAAAHIVVLSEGFKIRLLERGTPEGKITVIPNWTYEHAAVRPTPGAKATSPAAADGRFTVVYAGNMGTAQALDIVLDTAARLASRAPNARFVLLGEGIDCERLRTRRHNEALDNVIFLPRCPTWEVDEVLAGADTLLVHLKDDPLFAITVPSKTQAYLRAGKPILMGVRGDAARLVEEAGAGLSFAPESPEALADAIDRMMALGESGRRRMGEAGAAYYRQHLSLATGAARFAAIFAQARYAHRRGHGFKRLMDATIAGTALVILSVPILVIAAAVAFRIGRPVLFRQQRPGRYGEPFHILKFRTMTDARDASGEPLPDSQRLTSFGNWLRSSSLDELPALINVMRGQMSLVGPRPLLMRYTAFFTHEERLRLLVRPGVTGWAQVNGRNLVSWDRRLALDVWYVRNWSLWLDVRTLALTAWRVLRRHDVVVDPESVMQNLDEERRSDLRGHDH